MKRRFENLTRGAARAIKHWWLLPLQVFSALLLALSYLLSLFKAM